MSKQGLKNAAAAPAELKPIWLHDNLSEVMFWYLGVFMGILALISLPDQIDLVNISWLSWFKNLTWFRALDERSLVSPPVVFWIAVVAWIFFYVLYRFNLSRKNFLIVFGLVGTFIGIPAALELVGYGHFFEWLGDFLGSLMPAANSGAYMFLCLVCMIPWVANFIWSRTNTRAKLDASGLTVYYADGSSTTFDLIGLVTDESNFDYGEWLLSGNGRLKFKLKNGTVLFQMDRVIGLYWTPLLFWRKGLSTNISYALSFQGKVASVDVTNEIRQQNDDMTDHGDFDDHGIDDSVHSSDTEFK